MGNVLHRDLAQEHLHVPKYHAGSHALAGTDKITTLDAITMTGSIGPTSSGTLSIGYASRAFDYGYFDNIEAADSIYAKIYYGDGSNLTGISTTTDFISLTDTPSAYTGMASSGVRVNATEDSLEFFDPGFTDIDTLDIILGRGETSATHSITLSAGTISAEQLTSTDDITLTGDILSTASGVSDIGTVSLAFNDAYIDKVHLVADPTLPLQAATKQYVDTEVASIVDTDTLQIVTDRGAITTNSITTDGLSISGGSIAPTASGTIDIGSVSLAFDQAYIDKVYLEGDPTTVFEAATKGYVDDQIAGIVESDTLDIVVGRGSTTDTSITTGGLATGGLITPDASGTIDIGTTELAFDDAHIDQVYLKSDPTTPLQAATKSYVDTSISAIPSDSDTLQTVTDRGSTATNSITTAGLSITAGNIAPTASGTLDLGTTSLAWNDAHIDKVYLEADPTTPLQAATKNYVDNAVSGENLWDRVGTDLSPHTVLDNLTKIGSITASGNIEIAKSDIELRFTNETFEYARLERISAANSITLKNRTLAGGSSGSAWQINTIYQGYLSTGYVVLSDKGMTSDFTVQGWIYNMGAGWGNIFSATGASILQTRANDGSLIVNVGGFSQDTAAEIVDDTWCFVAVAYTSATNTAVAYVNSSREVFDTTGHSPNWVTARILQLAGGSAVDIAIDEVRLYNYARSDEQLVSDYNYGNGTYGSAEDGLILGYHFDEGSSNVAYNYGSATACDMSCAGAGGTYEWIAGHVPISAGMVENTIFSCTDGGVEQDCIVTVGDSDGLTELDGSSLALKIAGVDVATVDTAGDWDFTDSNLVTTGNLSNFADNSTHFFGAASDASITYDGTNMVIDPKNVGTGYLNVAGALVVDESLTTSAGRIANTTRYTTTQAIPVTDHVVFCNTDGGTFTVTLPIGVNGQELFITNCGSSAEALVIDGNGSETINGNLTQTIYDGESVHIVFETTEKWRVF